MYSIPTEIVLAKQSFAIRNRGDFRMVLDCFVALQDAELTSEERVIASLIIFYEDLNGIEDLNKLPDIGEAVIKMYEFFNCGQSDSYASKNNLKLIDWQQDSQLICSAVNKIANTEIRAIEYLHWWTFVGYYMAIGESPLSTIVSIRHKMLTGKKLEKYEQQFKRENPQYFTWNTKSVEQQEADNIARELWNNGG